jgi:DNA-binding response OmpR family regulator
LLDIEETRPSLVTLDLQLGVDDGLDVARTIRKRSKVPIVMVTGKDDVVDRVVGLELGADDYITKPFHVREVLARVRSVLRRAGDGQEPPATVAAEPAGSVETCQSRAYVFDGLKIVPDRFELFDREGRLCDLTSGDFKLLTVFLGNAKRVLSRDTLMDLTGGPEWSPLDRTIDNQVARLRKKIERDPANPKLIKTVRGVGYSFACEVTRA